MHLTIIDNVTGKPILIKCNPQTLDTAEHLRAVIARELEKAPEEIMFPVPGQFADENGVPIVLPQDVTFSVKIEHGENSYTVAVSNSASLDGPDDVAEVEPLHAGMKKRQVINPITVEAEGKVDYDALLNEWGCDRITDELVARFERVTGVRAHPLLRRGIYFSHRELDEILTMHEKGQPFYLYTGRGPSSGALHMGHMIPFIFTQFLQKAFNCPLVIQLTDDEKFFWKNLTLPEARRLARENAKDIIAFGFDITKTFIFQDTEYIAHMYPLVCEIQKRVTYNQIKAIFGFDNSTNCGRVAYPAIQAAPSFPQAFSALFGPHGNKMACLIPCAVDQDPYFRMTRDVARKLGLRKPALIHCKFVSALQGANSKMSASNPNSAVFTDDTPKQIRKKIKSYCKSGAPEKLEDHRAHGANLEEDVAWEYMNFFMEDDDELKMIGEEYSAGRMTTGEVKDRLANVVVPIIENFQMNRQAVTDEMVDAFMSVRRLI